MRLYHGIMFQLVPARHPRFLRASHGACGSHAALGTSGQAQPCATSRRWACSPVPGQDAAAPPQAALSGLCVSVRVRGEASVCVQCSEAGSGSPDAVMLELDSGEAEGTGAGRSGDGAGRLETAGWGCPPPTGQAGFYRTSGPKPRLQTQETAWILCLLYTEIIQMDTFRYLSRTCISQTVKQGVFPVGQGTGPCVWSRGLS